MQEVGNVTSRKKIEKSIFPIILLSFSIALSYQASYYSFGTLSKIGPGFFPFYVGILLAATSFIIVVTTILQPISEGFVSTSGTLKRDKGKRVFLVFFTTVAYVFFMGKLGFPIATFLFIFALFKFVESYKWLPSIVGAIATSVSSYLVFGLWLQCRFPKGWLGI